MADELTINEGEPEGDVVVTVVNTPTQETEPAWQTELISTMRSMQAELTEVKTELAELRSATNFSAEASLATAEVVAEVLESQSELSEQPPITEIAVEPMETETEAEPEPTQPRRRSVF